MPAIAADVAQRIIEDPKGSGREFTRFLMNGGRVQVLNTDGIAVPEGGRVHILSVPVDESRPWEDAIGAAGPDTNRSWDIWKVGDQYPAIAGAKSGLQQVILVNFGRYMSSEDVLRWGKSQHLVPASSRRVFAVGEHCPNLDKDLAMNPMAVVSLRTCSFGGLQRVSLVWWHRSLRGAFLYWFGCVWDGGYWFAFVRE